MNFRALIIYLFFLTSLSSCYKLQSDEELREDIVGTWYKTECKFPNNTEEQGVTEPSSLALEMTFHADGRFSEKNNGIVGYCSLDGCHPNTSISDCSCEWVIENGALIIIPNSSEAERTHLNQEFPILCLRKNRLAFDNVTLSYPGFSWQAKKTCFERE